MSGARPSFEPTFETSRGGSKERWMVVIFDNDVNTFEQVTDVLMTATGCDFEEALIETWEAHTYGKAPVHFASKQVCDDVATRISTIGVRTRVCPEWDD